MGRKRKPGVSPGGNLERVRAVLQRRRSGASGTHGDRRLKRLRVRGQVERAAVEESRG